jgi:peptide/nickel transport system permease protein
MLPYVGRRLLVAAVLLWGVLSVVFLVIRMIPGDVVHVLLAEGAPSAELIEARRKALGLDEPIFAQYAQWLRGVTRFDLGESLVTQRPIAADLGAALPRTIELAVAGLLIGAMVGIAAGIFAANRYRSAGDLLVTVGGLFGLSLPSFVTGTVLLLFFGLHLKWVPTAGYVALGADPVGHLRHLVLPALTLGVTLAAVTARFTQAAMLDVLGREFIRTARAKGLRERTVQVRHALRNAMIPVVTIVGVESGSLLGGTVIVEYIFNWPGMSTYLIQGVSRRDYPMVQAVVLVVAGLFLLTNLLVDVINAYVDPRIRYA